MHNVLTSEIHYLKKFNVTHYTVCGISPVSKAASNNILTETAINYNHCISLEHTMFQWKLIICWIFKLGESENYIPHLRPAFVVFIDVIRCLMCTIQPVHDFIRTRTCFVVIIFPVQPAYMPSLRLLTRSQRHLPLPPGTNGGGRNGNWVLAWRRDRVERSWMHIYIGKRIGQKGNNWC